MFKSHPVEVCVVWRTYGRVESKGLVGHDLDAMGHYGHSMQGRLAIEEDDIAVGQLPVDLPANIHLLCHLLAVLIRDLDAL